MVELLEKIKKEIISYQEQNSCMIECEVGVSGLPYISYTFNGSEFVWVVKEGFEF